MPTLAPIPIHQAWPRAQFSRFRACVAYVAGRNADGLPTIGTAFHVGEGVFVTARHVVESITIGEVGFDDPAALSHALQDPKNWGQKTHGRVEIISGPHFHPQKEIDVACFKVSPYPAAYIPLGGHLDDWMGQYELVLDRTVILGYPPIPLSNRPTLVASLGEINAVIDKYTGGHPLFIVSTIARGGFSGGPALIGYNEASEDGTAALGVVTEALIANGAAAERGYMAVLTVEPIYDCLEAHKLLPECQKLAD